VSRSSFTNSRGARLLRTALAFALPGLAALARIKLCALYGVPLHGLPFDAGQNVDGPGAVGGVGGGAAGGGLPGGGGGGGDGGNGGNGRGDGGGGGRGGGGSGDGPAPWWSRYVPGWDSNDTFRYNNGYDRDRTTSAGGVAGQEGATDPTGLANYEAYRVSHPGWVDPYNPCAPGCLTNNN